MASRFVSRRPLLRTRPDADAWVRWPLVGYGWTFWHLLDATGPVATTACGLVVPTVAQRLERSPTTEPSPCCRRCGEPGHDVIATRPRI